MERVSLNGVKVYPFTSHEELLAFNAEKILHATDQTRSIINRNIGYCDGFGAVMALKEKGHKEVIKIPGCELWLRIINMTYQQGKSYYLVGGKQEVIPVYGLPTSEMAILKQRKSEKIYWKIS